MSYMNKQTCPKCDSEIFGCKGGEFFFSAERSDLNQSLRINYIDFISNSSVIYCDKCKTKQDFQLK